MNKNILVINSQVELWGAGRSCAMLLFALKKAGYDVLMITNHMGPLVEILARDGVPCVCCKTIIWYPMARPDQKIGLIDRLRGIKNLLKKQKEYFSKINRVLKERNFIPDLVYSNTILECMGIHIAAYYKVPHIYHIREYGKEDFRMYFTLGTRLSYYLANRYTTKAICISKGVQKVWKKCFGDKAILIYNGIPCPCPHYIKHERSDNNLYIIIVGRLSFEKGQDKVIEVIASLQHAGYTNIFLDLYGVGVDENMLRNRVDRLHISDRVRFCGYQENIPYEKYDIAIMSSKSEAFGRTTIEYMYHGIPVIGYNGGATPELIQHERTGLIYSNDKELERYIIKTNNEYEDFQNYAKNAYLFANENFSDKICISKFMSTISEVIYKE